MQESTGLLQLERDRVKVQEKIQKIYNKKTKPTVWNSITKTEFLPTIYDVPTPPSFSSSPIIEGLDMDPSKKGDAKSKELEDKMNSKMDSTKSKAMGPMKKTSEYTKAFFLYFTRLITFADRNQILSKVKQGIADETKIVGEASNIIPDGTPIPNGSTDVNSETNSKTKKEIKAEKEKNMKLKD